MLAIRDVLLTSYDFHIKALAAQLLALVIISSTPNGQQALNEDILSVLCEYVYSLYVIFMSLISTNCIFAYRSSDGITTPPLESLSVVIIGIAWLATQPQAPLIEDSRIYSICMPLCQMAFDAQICDIKARIACYNMLLVMPNPMQMAGFAYQAPVDVVGRIIEFLQGISIVEDHFNADLMIY